MTSRLKWNNAERNCILVVGGSQIEQEILIALVFSLGEKEDVAKVAVKALVRWKQTDLELYGFLLPRCSETSHSKSYNLKDRNVSKDATRQGLLRRRLM